MYKIAIIHSCDQITRGTSRGRRCVSTVLSGTGVTRPSLDRSEASPIYYCVRRGARPNRCRPSSGTATGVRYTAADTSTSLLVFLIFVITFYNFTYKEYLTTGKFDSM